MPPNRSFQSDPLLLLTLQAAAVATLPVALAVIPVVPGGLWTIPFGLFVGAHVFGYLTGECRLSLALLPAGTLLGLATPVAAIAWLGSPGLADLAAHDALGQGLLVAFAVAVTAAGASLIGLRLGARRARA